MAHIPIRLRLIALALLLGFGAPASGELAHAVQGLRQYTVKPGDTLAAISQSLGVPVVRLMSANNLPDPDHILAGQTLLLPEDAGGAPADSSGGESRDYVVRQGDSLSRIATVHGLTVAALLEANNLADADRLTVGQKLTLPPGARAIDAGASAAPAVGTGGASDVASLLEAAAGRYKLDPALLKAVAWYLSSWKTEAASPAGALGVMQITTATQEWVGPNLLKRATDRTDPRENVEIGAAYLAYLINKLGDERQGVAAYLQGPAGLARSGLTPATSRALETIYGSRDRFSLSRGGASFQAAVPAGPTGGPDLSAAVVTAARAISADARLGVAARNLGSGQRIDVRSGEIFHSASVNKVAIMVELFRQLEAGTMARPAFSSDLERMITQSDNEAANRLVDLVGEKRVNSTMAGLGLGSTVLNNYFSAGRGRIDPGFNQSTPADMARLFGLLATDQLVSASASQEMRALLSRTQDASKLVRGLPAGTKVAHKSGWFSGVANDAGIVFASRGPYVVAVFSEGLPDSEAGNQLIAAVSRAIYAAWGT